MLALYISLSLIIGYLMGSISVSVILSKCLFKGDVREHGSGNAGATNMARVYGAKGGILVLLGDFLKAIIACTVVLLIAKDEYTEVCIMTTGVACILGHAFPVFFNFKGGKGVTVGAAIALIIDWKILVFIVIVFFVTFAFTHIVSISSILGATGLILSTLVFYVLNVCGLGAGYFANFTIYRLILGVVASVISIWLHRANIVRLIKGEEKVFTFKKKDVQPSVAVTEEK
ncbi:MAG: glycerol-3-phosphate 1-O-acyltransferase PlsY [Clostridia bacterium]|nr:glycerol-3-phosphate 1-O-acyltransferase PlsY [Clostridia bacterium]